MRQAIGEKSAFRLSRKPSSRPEHSGESSAGLTEAFCQLLRISAQPVSPEKKSICSFSLRPAISFERW